MAIRDGHSGTSITRALYAFLVMTAPLIGAYLFVDAWHDYLYNPYLSWLGRDPPWLLSWITFAGFIFPGVLAARRLLRRRPLIPAARLRERPVVATLVALCSAFAVCMAILITTVVADVWSTGADDIGGPLAFFGMLMAMATAIALLAAELALVGRSE